MSNRIVTFAKPEISSRFLAIPTEELIRVTEEAARSLGVDAVVERVSKARNKNPDARHFVKVSLPDLTQDVAGERLTPTLFWTNANNGTSSLKLQMGAYRFVCANGLYFGEAIFSQSIRHLDAPSVHGMLEQVPLLLRSGLDTIVAGGFADTVESALALPVRDAVDIIASLDLPTRAKEAALFDAAYGTGRPEDKMSTVWGVYQLVNESVRRRTRSAHAAAERDQSLLQDIEALAAAQFSEAA